MECAQLVRETVLESGQREPSLLDHATVNKNITTLIENVIVAFAQVSNILYFFPLCLKTILKNYIFC